MWAGVEPLGTHLSRLLLGLEFLEHIVVTLWSLLGPGSYPQTYILLELPNGHGIRLEGLNLWI